MFWVSRHMLLQRRMSSKKNIPQREYSRYVMGDIVSIQLISVNLDL